MIIESLCKLSVCRHLLMKATGQLRALAMQASLLAILLLLVSVPVYWIFGESRADPHARKQRKISFYEASVPHDPCSGGFDETDPYQRNTADAERNVLGRRRCDPDAVLLLSLIHI